MNPIFTIPYLRDTTPMFHDVAYRLRDALEATIEDQGSTIEMMSWIRRAALDLIGQAGLGHAFRSIEGEADRYLTAAKQLMYET
jgi:hypothetical protein